MKNQQASNIFSFSNDQSVGIYAKNPRYKLQKLMKTKIVQLNQKCLLTKCIAQQDHQVATIQNKNKRQATLSFRYHQKNRNGYQTQRKQILKQSRKFIESQNNIQTIDTMKQKISQTLLRDLVSLQNLQKQLVTSNNKKNAVKIKLMPARRRSLTINYNQCCSLAQHKFQDQLLINGIHDEPDCTPKLGIHQTSRCKTISPMILVHKKKELTKFRLQSSSDDQQQQQLTASIIIKKKPNYMSPHKRKYYQNKFKIQDHKEKQRKQQFSPWEINQKLDANPQISDFLSNTVNKR